MRPVVAIVGRPNVGKSTLFNRILGRRKAIVADLPGVTRDLNFADTEELGVAFTLVDTGGFEPGVEDDIFAKVKEQAMVAVEDAQVIVLVMDGRGGVTPGDRELAGFLRRSGKPVVYAVNKLDSDALETGLGEFYELGVDPVLAMSAEHGRGLNELVDAVIERLPEKAPAPEPADGRRTSIAILGRPNAGKSSLLNRLIGRERSIVSDVAGTTRDVVDTPVTIDGRDYLFVDTAGIRKKSRISLQVEAYSVMEAIRTIDRCDAAVLVIDGVEGLSVQDEKIASLIEDRKKCCVIAVNKWDLVDKDTRTTESITGVIRDRMPFISYAPVVFISALTGQRATRVLEAVDRVVEMSGSRVKTSELNRFVEEITYRHKPAMFRGRTVKFYYATQSGVSPPTFVIFTNFPEGVDVSYRRYVTNRLREVTGIDEVPMKVFFRKRH